MFNLGFDLIASTWSSVCSTSRGKIVFEIWDMMTLILFLWEEPNSSNNSHLLRTYHVQGTIHIGSLNPDNTRVGKIFIV